MKPGKRPQGANYAQGYDEALKRVMRAFRGPQLIQLANQLGFDDKLPQTQREIAQILLEKSWDWEPPYLAGHKEKDELQVVPKGLPICLESFWVFDRIFRYPYSPFPCFAPFTRRWALSQEISDSHCSIQIHT